MLGEEEMFRGDRAAFCAGIRNMDYEFIVRRTLPLPARAYLLLTYVEARVCVVFKLVAGSCGIQ